LNIVAARGATGKNQLTLPLFLCYNKWRGKLKMSIKLALLKSGETVISEMQELVSEDTEQKRTYGYLFSNPRKVIYATPMLLTEEEDRFGKSVEVSFSPWILLSKDTEILVPVDWVVTLVEPIDSLKETYEKELNGSTN
jgi:hypothetical protein